MNSALLLMLTLAIALGAAGVATAHIEVGADLNADGDCDDAGEHVADLPGAGMHAAVCAPWG